MSVSVLNTVLKYFQRFGWFFLPCQWQGERRKQPLIANGFRAAASDPRQIEAWWTRWPLALIGVATGASGLAVLDVDVKEPRKYGPDSLEELGHSILDDSWIVHTGSGGWHVYYDALEADIPSTSHTLGLGLDVRGNTGYVIAPSPGSGYRWDPYNHPGTMPLAPAPAWLIPVPEPESIVSAKPIIPCVGLSPYADAAIEHACQAIRHAADGQQRVTLLKEAFTIGTLAGADGIPEAFAQAALFDAACGMRNYDPHAPWTKKEILRNLDGAFAAGCRKPRRASR